MASMRIKQQLFRCLSETNGSATSILPRPLRFSRIRAALIILILLIQCRDRDGEAWEINRTWLRMPWASSGYRGIYRCNLDESISARSSSDEPFVHYMRDEPCFGLQCHEPPDAPQVDRTAFDCPESGPLQIRVGHQMAGFNAMSKFRAPPPGKRGSKPPLPCTPGGSSTISSVDPSQSHDSQPSAISTSRAAVGGCASPDLAAVREVRGHVGAMHGHGTTAGYVFQLWPAD